MHSSALAPAPALAKGTSPTTTTSTTTAIDLTCHETLPTELPAENAAFVEALLRSVQAAEARGDGGGSDEDEGYPLLCEPMSIMDLFF